MKSHGLLLILWVFLLSGGLIGQPGTIDTSFFDQGLLLYSDPGFSTDVNAILPQDDGSWVTVGQRRSGFGAHWLMLAYRADGSQNTDFGVGNVPTGPTFGPAGIVQTDIPGVTSEDARAACLTPSGKIYVGGEGFANGIFQWVIARYHPDGRLDSAFSQDGILIGDWASGGFGGVQSLWLQPDGHLLAVGGKGIARIDSTGALDPGFGNQGIASIAGGESIQRVLGDAAGNCYVATIDFTGGGTEGKVGLLKFSPSGQPDTGFGTNGAVSVTVTEYAEKLAMAFTPSGKILIAVDRRINSGNDSELLLLQFNPDGTPDAGFGTNGQASPLSDAEVYDLLVQPDGRILISGRLRTGNIRDLLVARFLPAGNLDTSFGNGGIFQGGLGNASGETGYGQAIALLPDSNLLVGGTAYQQGQFPLIVMRINNNLDSLGTGGNTAISRAENPIRFYPNPAHGWIQIDLPEGHWTLLRLLDLQGTIIRERAIDGAGRSVNWTLDEVPPGMYLLQASRNQGAWLSSKMIIH